jgi:hypothetical protein
MRTGFGRCLASVLGSAVSDSRFCLAVSIAAASLLIFCPSQSPLHFVPHKKETGKAGLAFPVFAASLWDPPEVVRK